jgi:hypothetical protein
MRAFGTIEGPVGVWRQLTTTPYREGNRLLGRRVLCGALSRLEPGAATLLRSTGGGDVNPTTTAAACPARAQLDP